MVKKTTAPSGKTWVYWTGKDPGTLTYCLCPADVARTANSSTLLNQDLQTWLQELHMYQYRCIIGYYLQNLKLQCQNEKKICLLDSDASDRPSATLLYFSLNFYQVKTQNLPITVVHKLNVSVTGSDSPAAGNRTRCSRTREGKQREQLTQGGNSCDAFTVLLKALYGAGLRLQEQEHKQ